MGGNGKGNSLRQLGGGSLPQQSVFLGVIGASVTQSPAVAVAEKPEKKDNFSEAMVGNIRRKFRNDV